MSKEKKLDWEIYESTTKYIYETLGSKHGVIIEGYGNTCKVTGNSGVEHQIDVLTLHTDGIHKYRTAIERKHWKKKVNKDIVMKLAEVIQDSNIDKGIIVCQKGFTQDGIDFAEYKNIGLVELRELEKNDLEENSPNVNIGNLFLNIKTTLTRTEIVDIDIGNNRKIDIKN